MVEQRTSFGLVISGGFIYLAIGIAALVISEQYSGATCGIPPADASFQLTLQQWVFGTGIAYIIIGSCFSVFALVLICSVIGIIPLILVWLFSGLFLFCWVIVGGISVWQYGGDCKTAAYSLWAMGMAAEIITLIMVIFACCAGKKAKDDDE